MKQRVPREILKFRADPVLRRAILFRAALRDIDLQDVIVDVLRTGLSDEIAEVIERGLVEPSTSDAKLPRKHKMLKSRV